MGWGWGGGVRAPHSLSRFQSQFPFVEVPLPTKPQPAFTLIAFSVSCFAILYLSNLREGDQSWKTPRFNSAKEKTDIREQTCRQTGRPDTRRSRTGAAPHTSCAQPTHTHHRAVLDSGTGPGTPAQSSRCSRTSAPILPSSRSRPSSLQLSPLPPPTHAPPQPSLGARSLLTGPPTAVRPYSELPSAPAWASPQPQPPSIPSWDPSHETPINTGRVSQ